MNTRRQKRTRREQAELGRGDDAPVRFMLGPIVMMATRARTPEQDARSFDEALAAIADALPGDAQ